MTDFPQFPNQETPKSALGDSTQVFEGLSIHLVPAPILKRMLAYTIDVAIVSCFIYGLFLVLLLLFLGGSFAGIALKATHLLDNLSAGVGLIGLIALLVVAFLGLASLWHGYFVYYELKKGTTPGKSVLGLRVIATKRNRLGFGQVVLRDLFRYIDAMLVLPGLITMLLNEKRQRLGDMAAGTLVVYSREKEAKSQFLYIGSEDYYALREALQPGPLAPDFAQRFLRFTYPYFITGKGSFTLNDVEQWVGEVRGQLTGPNVDGTDSQTLLRFFAEHCLQSTNSKKGGSRNG